MELIASAPNQAIHFQTICRKNNIELSEEKTSQLSRYVELILEWNKKINLISRKDEANIWDSHILHSASILFLKNMLPSSTILDLGTGGGLPGIVLKILRPDLEVMLLDATYKKILAVQQILSKLKLTGITARWGRAEELSNSGLAGRFDLVVARAVASLSDLAKWAIPVLKKGKGGDSQIQNNLYLQSPALLALKGGDLESEISKTRKVVGLRKISSQPLVFAGSERLGGIDKKLVTIYF